VQLKLIREQLDEAEKVISDVVAGMRRGTIWVRKQKGVYYEVDESNSNKFTRERL
jgi:hypothetical protein